jgi:L-amino acid N-acyltransferase YncA
VDQVIKLTIVALVSVVAATSVAAARRPAPLYDPVALHSRRGFREAGRLHAVGWKHGRWLDSLYMQLELPLAPD